jgi:hypothetical protein
LQHRLELIDRSIPALKDESTSVKKEKMASLQTPRARPKVEGSISPIPEPLRKKMHVGTPQLDFASRGSGPSTLEQKALPAVKQEPLEDAGSKALAALGDASAVIEVVDSDEDIGQQGATGSCKNIVKREIEHASINTHAFTHPPSVHEVMGSDEEREACRQHAVQLQQEMRAEEDGDFDAMMNVDQS